jgi:hypothetical protein
VNSRCESSQYSFHVWKKFKFERKSELDRANCPAESDRNPLPNEQRRSWIGDPTRKRVGSESKNEEDFIFIEVFRRVFRLSLPCPVFFPFRRRIPWHPYHIGGHLGDLVHLSSCMPLWEKVLLSLQGESIPTRIFWFSYFFLINEGQWPCPLLWPAIRPAIWPAIRCLRWHPNAWECGAYFVPGPAHYIDKILWHMISDLKWTFYSTSQIRYTMIILSQYNLYRIKNHQNISYSTCTTESSCQAVEIACV